MESPHHVGSGGNVRADIHGEQMAELIEFRDRVTELRRVPASELIPNPSNFRQHSVEQKAAIRAVLGDIGFAGAELAYETDEGLILLDGHARQEIAGDQLVPVLVLDITQAEADIVLATYDHLGTMATVDDSALRELLESIETDSPDIAALLTSMAEDAEITPLESSSSEIDTDDFKMQCACPKCGFEFDPK